MKKLLGSHSLLLISALLCACGDSPAAFAESDQLDYAAGYGLETGESGDVGRDGSLDESSESASAGDGDGDGGPDSWLDPEGKDSGEGGPLPEAGLCTVDGEFIAGCSNEDPLTLDCSPAFIALCESSGYAFEPIDPEAASWGWDCDNYNEFISDCTDDWFAACEQVGGLLDCINWEGDDCVEASCETEAPEPG